MFTLETIENDIRIDMFRPYSGIRVTHIPTGFNSYKNSGNQYKDKMDAIKDVLHKLNGEIIFVVCDDGGFRGAFSTEKLAQKYLEKLHEDGIEECGIFEAKLDNPDDFNNEQCNETSPPSNLKLSANEILEKLKRNAKIDHSSPVMKKFRENINNADEISDCTTEDGDYYWIMDACLDEDNPESKYKPREASRKIQELLKKINGKNP